MAAVAASALSDAAAGFNAIAARDHMPAPSVYAPPPPYMSPTTPMPVQDICLLMSCPRPAPPPTQFIPYTPGGGNPSGYGLLVQ
jgi:hypothetical protein